MGKLELGHIAERIAADYLRTLDYKILEYNFYTRYGEIDIIAQKSTEIIFVEVKSLNNSSLLFLEELVSKRKLDHIHKAGQLWLERYHGLDTSWRYEYIGIRMGDPMKLEHIMI